MFIQTLAAAAANAAPQNKFGFVEALQAGGFISYATVTILGIMSFGSFFILFTKWFEQSKILKQGGDLRTGRHAQLVDQPGQNRVAAIAREQLVDLIVRTPVRVGVIGNRRAQHVDPGAHLGHLL